MKAGEGVAILEDSSFFIEKGNNIENQSCGKKQIREVDCGKENEHKMLEAKHG